MEKRIKALTFDLDHTLFDRYSTMRGLAYLLRVEKQDWFAPDMYAAKLGDILVDMDKKWIYGGWELVYEKLLEGGYFHHAPSCALFKQEILSMFGRVAVPIPGVLTMLKALRQTYALGLITNGAGSLQRKKLELLGLKDSFDAIVVSGEVGFNKPDPRIFQLMCRMLRCDPQEMLFIGDGPKTDIQGAYGAGITPVWVSTCGAWPFPELKRAPYEIHDVTELPQLLRLLQPHPQ